MVQANEQTFNTNINFKMNLIEIYASELINNYSYINCIKQLK